MARRMSQRHRIERLQAEAAATEREKEEKRKAREAAGLTKKPATRRKAAGSSGSPSSGASSGRMKAVWVVCARNGTVAKTYPYNQRAAADAEAQRLTDKKDSEHYVKADKVPFED